jgi:serine/threonine protein kinase
MSGSPFYAAPEILSGERYDPRKSDLWSCGVILFVMTTGSLPWTGPSIQEVFEQIKAGQYQTPSFLSDQCRDLIRKLMCIEVERRFGVKEALEHPWMKDAMLPTLYDLGTPSMEVTMRDVDVFFGIVGKEVEVAVPESKVSRSLVELPLLIQGEKNGETGNDINTKRIEFDNRKEI